MEVPEASEKRQSNRVWNQTENHAWWLHKLTGYIPISKGLVLSAKSIHDTKAEILAKGICWHLIIIISV